MTLAQIYKFGENPTLLIILRTAALHWNMVAVESLLLVNNFVIYIDFFPHFNISSSSVDLNHI